MRARLRAVLAAGLLAWSAGFAQARDERSGQFDSYVLALSWSPTYCLSEKASPAQCRTGRPHGFVVHGLWPHMEGDSPGFCQSPPPYVPEPVITAMMDLMPSKGLILHEWRRHGTCSGLTPEGYFDTVRAAAGKVNVPQALRAPTDALRMTTAEVEAAFLEANPGLTPDMIGVDCASGRLKEVRICLSRTLSFTSCPDVDRRSCAADRVLKLPAPRARP